MTDNMKFSFLQLLLKIVFYLPCRLVFWVRYHGLRNIPGKGRLIVCCNHKSVFDPILLVLPFPRQINYMAKEELFTDHGALAGGFLRLLGAFPVRRNTGDVASVRTAEQILERGGVVGIFPQGGCVAENSMSHMKAGAAMLAVRTGAPILPVSIYCDGKPFLFKRVTVRYGSVIRCRDSGAPVGVRKEIRACASLVAERINAMLEEKY